MKYYFFFFTFVTMNNGKNKIINWHHKKKINIRLNNKIERLVLTSKQREAIKLIV